MEMGGETERAGAAGSGLREASKHEVHDQSRVDPNNMRSDHAGRQQQHQHTRSSSQEKTTRSSGAGLAKLYCTKNCSGGSASALAS